MISSYHRTSVWCTILMTSCQCGRKKQLPLSLTEGGRISLKVLRVLPYLSYSQMEQTRALQRFSISSLLLLLIRLTTMKEDRNFYGGLWTLKANISHWPIYQKNLRHQLQVASLLHLWVGLLIELQSKQSVPQIVLQFSGAYQMGHWMKIMKPVAIAQGRITAQGAQILEQCNPWQVILHFCWFLHGQDKTSEGEHFM